MKQKFFLFFVFFFYLGAVKASTIDSISLKMGTDIDLCSKVPPYGLPYSGFNNFDSKNSIETTIRCGKLNRNLFKKIKKISKKVRSGKNQVQFSEYSLNILRLTLYYNDGTVQEFSFNSHMLVNYEKEYHHSKDIIKVFLMLRKELNQSCQFQRMSELSDWNEELNVDEERQDNFLRYDCPSCPDCDYHIIKFDDSDFYPNSQCPYIEVIFKNYRKKKALKICREFLLLSRVNS